MFAGRKRRSSNVKVMQLFHELKQQFPTVPDHIVNSCISSYVQAKEQGKSYNIAEYIESALAESNLDPMGRPSQQLESPLHPLSSTPDPDNASAEVEKETLTSATVQTTLAERSNIDMTESASNSNRKQNHSSVPCSKPNELKTVAKRPDHLDIKSENIANFESSIDNKRNFNIQLSEKCKDIHKLLNCNISDKPPRSPVGAKRLNKCSPTKLEKSPLLPPDTQEELTRESVKPQDNTSGRNINKTDVTKNEDSCLNSQRTSSKDELNKVPLGAIKKELCSTPTQTTDTLNNTPTPNVNLSLNVNLDVLQSPPPPRRTSVLRVTPSQPWLQTPTSPRSFTSVNLTLRSPSSTPQDPIDITSHNAGMTYSTSNFDAEKGLGSRLQITVGPGGSGSVQAVRLRPRSFHQQETDQEVVPTRAGSLNNLAVNSEPPLLLKQKARLERLRTELNTGKARYAALKKEVEELEKKRLENNRMVDREIERQLEMEIKHLRNQCGKLEIDVFSDDFYSNIYEGQRLRHRNRRRLPYPGPSLAARIPPDIEGPKWNCGLCTFLNHPDLDKCEQCEMPRIVHGTKPTEAFNPNVALHTQNQNNILDRSFSLRHIHPPPNSLNTTRPIGFIFDQNGQGMNMPSHIAPSRSAPNILK